MNEDGTGNEEVRDRVLFRGHVGGTKGSRKASASLRAARKVSKTEERDGEDGLVKMYRELQKKDPGKFLAELRGMEREWASLKNRNVQGAQVVPESEVVDLGTDRCVELCEGWLREWADKNKVLG